jgi:hypothetical protein
MTVDLKRVLSAGLALACLYFVLWLIIFTISRSDYWDFDVFYRSAQAALRGESIYRGFGSHNLPYWYFPWVAWFFVPLTTLSFEAARVVYVLISVFCAILVIHCVGRFFNPNLAFGTQVFIFGMSLVMCWLLFRVGQVDFILVAVVILTVFLIDKGQSTVAGLLFPLLLFKPHLRAIFIPFAILRGGRRFLVSALISVLVVSALAFILIPDWPLEMVRMLSEHGQRTNTGYGFATLPELIGRQENWSGTANLGLTGLLFILAFAAAWKSQHLPTVPFLAFTLAASMLCAPRAYSYNFPFLLPPLLWISVGGTGRALLIWTSIAIVSVMALFSTGTYLIVLMTFVLSVLKAYRPSRRADGIA